MAQCAHRAQVNLPKLHVMRLSCGEAEARRIAAIIVETFDPATTAAAAFEEAPAWRIAVVAALVTIRLISRQNSSLRRSHEQHPNPQSRQSAESVISPLISWQAMPLWRQEGQPNAFDRGRLEALT